jgi:hypothetical protein
MINARSQWTCLIRRVIRPLTNDISNLSEGADSKNPLDSQVGHIVILKTVRIRARKLNKKLDAGKCIQVSQS